MNAIIKCLVLGLAVAAAGCASRPLVDPKQTDMVRYEQDLKECQQLAEQKPGAGTGAAVGAAAGVALGEAVGRTGGLMSQRGHLSGTGALIGAVSGASAAARGQASVVRRCLQGRGHVVLD